MREIVNIQLGQCGNQIGEKVSSNFYYKDLYQFIHIQSNQQLSNL